MKNTNYTDRRRVMKDAHRIFKQMKRTYKRPEMIVENFSFAWALHSAWTTAKFMERWEAMP